MGQNKTETAAREGAQLIYVTVHRNFCHQVD